MALAVKMKMKIDPTSGRNFGPCGPMFSFSRPVTNPTMSSRTIWSLPGLSTLNDDRTARLKTSTPSTIRPHMTR